MGRIEHGEKIQEDSIVYRLRNINRILYTDYGAFTKKLDKTAIVKREK